MINISTKYKIAVAIIWFFPFGSFAQTNSQTCASVGYTIATINGVFTDKDGAIANSDELRRKMQPVLHGTYNNQPIDFQFLLNPSHIAGLGDIAMSAYQKYFDDETVKDYDLVNMLGDASEKVKTQKLLLVAHSQGNFYANSFYDTVADKQGGVPAQSIGVYGVATPASRVAGGGNYISSKTDKVLKDIRDLGLYIMEPKEDIKLGAGDDPRGHDFSEIYLKYRTGKIVSGIQSSLDKLSSDPEKREDIRCIDPPELTIAHKVVGATLYVVDPVANATKVALMSTYNGSVFVVKTATQVARAVGSTVSSFAQTLLQSTGGLAGTNNSASVILATQNKEPVPVINKEVVVEKNTIKNPKPALVVQKINKTPPPSIVVSPAFAPSGNPLPQETPHLIFIGSLSPGFGGGAPALPQILGDSETAPPVPEIVTKTGTTDEEVFVEKSTGAALAAPVLSAFQCSASLATDGCLIATTTLHFEWPAVTEADHYAISKNGVYATTTETSFDIMVPDFSDYTLEIASVDNMGITSATSTQKVSVATIPIAINEIAWMGTVASSNDEWLELKNNTAYTIDLSQWALATKDGTPYIKLTKTIAPREYILLERTRDTNVSDVLAHQVYTGALKNTGEQLTLSYASTTLDQTPLIVGNKWVAGENTSTTTKKTMERYASKESGADTSNWGTNLGFIKNGLDSASSTISGTPGRRNSVSYLVNKGQDITKDFTLTAEEGSYVIPKLTTITADATLTIEPGVTTSFYNNPTTHETGILIVQGRLDVQGTSTAPVVFDSFTPGQQQGSLFFVGGFSSATSTIEHALFKNTANMQVYNNAKVKISDSDFVGNQLGVRVGLNGTAEIENSRFSHTFNSAIDAFSGATLIVASTTIDSSYAGGGINTYDSKVSIATTTVQAVDPEDGATGISVHGGTATISGATVSGFTSGSGISVGLGRIGIDNQIVVPGVVANISGTEVTGNNIGVKMETGSAIIAPDVSIHDNVANLSVCAPGGLCVES